MTEVISVRFRGGCKSYYFDPKDLHIAAGEHVIVETAAGTEFVTCCEGNHQVPDQIWRVCSAPASSCGRWASGTRPK